MRTFSDAILLLAWSSGGLCLLFSSGNKASGEFPPRA
jgi:hypothetical protein